MEQNKIFFYVHRSGWVTEDPDQVKGHCVRVIEAHNKEEAERIARDFGDID